jgi:hypothetical protein
LLTLTQEEEVRLVIEECHEHWGLMQQIFEYVGRPVLFVFSLLQFPTSTSALLFAPPQNNNNNNNNNSLLSSSHHNKNHSP